MNTSYVRASGRKHNEMRKITVSTDILSNAHTSVLLGFGNTKVLCAITMQPQVPHFLKGTKKGWLTAEYAMLPTSTSSRITRDSASKFNGRSIEISRLIGRSLRSMVDLSILGERTIIVDCDVLQADGGTRTACITAASLALRIAVHRWIVSRVLRANIITDPVAAVSVGMDDNNVLLDIDYKEDSSIGADYNFVLSQSGNVVEIQGGVEKGSMSWEHFEQVRSCALQGIKTIFDTIDSYVKMAVVKKDLPTIKKNIETSDTKKRYNKTKQNKKAPLFSILSRQESVSSS